MNSSRIFISYNYQDYKEASIIKDKLESFGLEVFTGEFNSGQDFYKKINYSVNSSDYFLILLSHHNEKSEWARFEMNKVRHDFYYRDVVILPVMISKVKKPYSLKNVKTFNLYENFESNLDKLSLYLKNIKYLDFNLISQYEFVDLITDLLVKLKFKIDGKEVIVSDFGVDIIASSRNNNQLVGSFTTNWIIECKFYRSARIDLSTIKKLSQQLLTNFPNYNGILITNSLITSTSVETLEIIKKKEKVNIELVDGRKLKQLLLNFPELIERYFNGKEGF